MAFCCRRRALRERSAPPADSNCRVCRCCRWPRGLRPPMRFAAVSGLTVDLRWPNDLLIGPRKTGGILVEAHTEGQCGCICSSGHRHQRASAQFRSGSRARPQPRSISKSAAGFRARRLLVSLLKSLERETAALADAAAEKAIPARVALASTWIRGRSVEVHGPQACIGVTAGLDRHGFLLVQHRCRSGDGADGRHSRRRN